MCQFTQQIIPQFDIKDRNIWNLNEKYYIFGATGTSQPDGNLINIKKLNLKKFILINRFILIIKTNCFLFLLNKLNISNIY